MPRILGEEAFTSMPGLAPAGPVDPGSSSIGSGLKSAGTSFYRAGVEADRQSKLERDKANRLELAKAKSLFYQSKVKADNDYKNDNDFATIAERYDKDLGEAASLAGELITDDYTRALFEEEIDLDRAQGMESINALAFSKRADVELAGFDQSAQANKEAFIQGDNATREAIIDANEIHLEGLYQEGMIDKQQLVEMKEKVASDYLLGAASVMPAEQLTDFLKSDVAKKLPIEERAKLKAAAETETLRGNAQAKTDELMGLSDPADRLKAARKIGNANLRDEVVRRVVTRNAEEESAEQSQRAEVFDSVHKRMLDGESLDSITREEMSVLTSSNYKTLIDLEQKRAKGQKVETDWKVWTELEAMEDVSQIDPLEYRSSLSDTEYKDLVERVNGSKGEGNYNFTWNESKKEMRKTALSEVGINPDSDRGLAFTKYVTNALYSLELEKSEDAGKSVKASPMEYQEILDQGLKVTKDAPLFFDDTLRFEVDPGAELRGVPEEDRAAIEDALKSEGIPITPQIVMSIYEQRNG